MFPGGDPPVPDQVTGVQITGTTSYSVSASWNSANNATSYNAYVNDALHTGGIVSTNATLSGLTSGTTFQISVAGQNSTGEGLKSSIVSATTGTSAPVGDLSVLRAFPGAEGGGALSVGGRGGRVIYVTNLNNSGAGSFREACQASGARIVVFRVGGTINVTSEIAINNPYLTIAGQTAPGGGIQLNGKGVTGWDMMFRVNTHHVIVRNVKFRKGLASDCAPSGPRSGCTGIFNFGDQQTRHIVFDHCSIFWSGDTNLSIFTLAWNTDSPDRCTKNVSIQNCIITEPTACNAHTNVGIGAPEGAAWRHENMTDIDYHNNLLAHWSHRGVMTSTKTGRIVNNIFYNWRNGANEFSPGCHWDIIGNRFKHGPVSGPARSGITAQLDTTETRFMTGDPLLYVAGNLAPNQTDPDADNWPMVRRTDRQNSSDVGPLPVRCQRLSPLPPLAHPIAVKHVNTLEGSLLPHVGASQIINSQGQLVVGARDAADTRIINTYNNGTGALINSETDVGGFPTIAGGTEYACTAGDGIADAWKTRNGLSVNTRYNTGPGGSAQVGPTIPGLNGWTYIDLFLAGLDIP
jgi:pectate lyase